MHTYTSIDASGKALQVTSARSREAAIACAHPDAVDSIAGAPDDLSECYWGFAVGQWVTRPARPSPHHVFDWPSKQWVDPRTLQDLKDAKWAQIKRARDAAEYGGFEWDGSAFDSDAISQARIQGAAQLASMTPGFSIDWTLATNEVRTLGAADMLAVGMALGVHVGAQFSRARALRLLLDAASTAQEVDAIAWGDAVPH